MERKLSILVVVLLLSAGSASAQDYIDNSSLDINTSLVRDTVENISADQEQARNLTEANQEIRELQQENQRLRSRIATLEARITMLEQKIEQLRDRLDSSNPGETGDIDTGNVSETVENRTDNRDLPATTPHGQGSRGIVDTVLGFFG